MQSRALLAQVSHVEALKARHAALSGKIEQVQTMASVDDWYVRDLKRQKLRLKEEIEGIDEE